MEASRVCYSYDLEWRLQACESWISNEDTKFCLIFQCKFNGRSYSHKFQIPPKHVTITSDICRHIIICHNETNCGETIVPRSITRKMIFFPFSFSSKAIFPMTCKIIFMFFYILSSLFPVFSLSYQHTNIHQTYII